MKLMPTCVTSILCVSSSLFTFFRQVFDEDLDGDRSMVEKTVNLSVADGEGYHIVNDPVYDGS